MRPFPLICRRKSPPPPTAPTPPRKSPRLRRQIRTLPLRSPRPRPPPIRRLRRRSLPRLPRLPPRRPLVRLLPRWLRLFPPPKPRRLLPLWRSQFPRKRLLSPVRLRWRFPPLRLVLLRRRLRRRFRRRLRRRLSPRWPRRRIPPRLRFKLLWPAPPLLRFPRLRAPALLLVVPERTRLPASRPAAIRVARVGILARLLLSIPLRVPPQVAASNRSTIPLSF